MQHIIRRQVLELGLSGGQPAFDLQNRLSSYFYDHMLPLLESVFDEWSDKDRVLYIDKLELDLGVFSGNQWEEVFGNDGMTRKLGESLRKALEQAGPGGTGQAAYYNGTAHALEQWIWYMEKGYLPWSILSIGKEWENKVLQTLATDHRSIGRLRVILQNQGATVIRIVRQHPESFLVSLVEILTAVKQDRLAEGIKALCRAFADITRAGHASSGIAGRDTHGKTASGFPQPWLGSLSSYTPEEGWRQLLAAAADAGNEGDTDSLLIALISFRVGGIGKLAAAGAALAAASTRLRLSALSQVVQRLLSDPSSLQSGAIHGERVRDPQKNEEAEPWQGPLSQSVDKKSPTGPTVDDPGSKGDDERSDEKKERPVRSGQDRRLLEEMGVGAPPIGEEHPMLAASAGLSAAPPQQSKETDRKKEQERSAFDADGREIGEEGLFVRNAGVILTHAFLHSLFKKTGLVKDGRFADARGQQKGVYMLYYLATGNREAEEHELVVPKVLCGWPLAEPVEKKSGLGKKALREAEDMLQGMIHHWNVKNISVEGLRGNFLTRNGKIYTKNGKMHLVIEKHPVDILVRTFPFPWNMSIIKLPWKKEFIHLEW